MAENGINSTVIQVPMKHAGTEAKVDRIRNFLLAHTLKVFIITPPGDEKGLYHYFSRSWL